MSANEHRGEVALTLGGVEYKLRPDITAIMRWERETGKPTAELLLRMPSGMLPLSDIAHVACAALQSGGCGLSHAEVAARLVADGVGDAVVPLGKLLLYSLTGGKEPKAASAEAGPEAYPIRRLWKHAAAIGLTPDQFWHMTPHELVVAFDGFALRNGSEDAVQEEREEDFARFRESLEAAGVG